MKVGYARVSSIGQNLDSQLDILESVGCEKIFKEKKSGKKTFNRIELAAALDFVRECDEFVVTRLDRCSRSVGDLHKIIDELKKKGVDFTCTEQPELNTNTSSGKLNLNLYGKKYNLVNQFQKVQKDKKTKGQIEMEYCMDQGDRKTLRL